MAQVVVWGGEPLLRQDLPELLLAARRAGLFVTLITNGWYRRRALGGAARRRRRAHPQPRRRRRGARPAARAPRAVRPSRGLRRMVRDDPLRPTLLLNTVLSRQNPGALRRVAEVARRWGAGPLLLPDGDRRAQRRRSRRPARRSRALAAGAAGGGQRSPWSSRRPGTRSSTPGPTCELLAADPSLSAYTCRAPRARLTVGADGSVRDCLHVDRPLANVRDLWADGLPLASLFRLARLAPDGGRGRALHQVQQPGRRRAVLALGPAAGDARQGRSTWRGGEPLDEGQG